MAKCTLSKIIFIDVKVSQKFVKSNERIHLMFIGSLRSFATNYFCLVSIRTRLTKISKSFGACKIENYFDL